MASQGRTILVLGGVLVVGVAAAIFAMMSDGGDSTHGATGEDAAAAPVTTADAPPDKGSAGPRRGAKAGSASINGEIRRSKGKVPVADQEVELIPERGQSWTVKTDAQGAFKLTELPHGGPYELRVAAPKCGTVRIPGIALDRNEKRDVGTLWLDPAVSVTVEVKTWAAEPAEGALVEAFVIAQADNFDWTKAFAQMGQAPVAVAKVPTNAAGVAVFSELATGRWSFVASKPGFARSGRTSVSVRSDVPVPPVKLFLGTGHSLTGKVIDAAKQPVAGALVLAGGNANGWDIGAAALRSRATTDPEGKYAFSALDAGDTVLMVGRAGGVPSQVATVRIPNVTVFDVTLKGTATVNGVVTEKESGKPVEAVTVRAWNWGNAGSSMSESTTDAAGKYSVVVTEGTVGNFMVEKAGWVNADDPTRQRPPMQIREGETQTRDLQLKPGAKVTGVVTGPDGPIAGAKVWVHFGSPNTGWQQKMALSDSEGKYEALGVSPGKAVVRADYAGHYVKDFPDNYWMIMQQPGPSPFKIDVPEGGTGTKDLVMAKGSSVDGRVEGPEGPLAGVRVASQQDWEGGAITGPDGTFHVEGVKPGPTVMVYPTLEGYAPSPSNKPIAVTTDKPATDIVLKMVRVGSVRGVVTVADGSPLKEGRVSVSAWQDQNEGNPYWSQQQQQGVKYPVRPDGSYEVPLGGMSTGKFRVNLTAIDRPAAQSEITPIVEGQSEYVVNLSVDGGRDLEGRVVMKQGGAPVAGAQVSLRARQNQPRGGMQYYDGMGGGGGSVVWALSDAEGKFAVSHLSASPYTVSATCTGFVGGSASVDLATAQIVTVELDAEMTIEGTVMYTDGAVIEGAQIGATRDDPAASGMKHTMEGMPVPSGGQSAWATSGSGGRFRMTGLVTGNYKLRVQQDWQGELNIKTKTTDPIAAGTTGVKITVDAGSVIAGRVLDPSKKPAANIQLSANPESKDGKRPEGVEGKSARTREDGSFSIGGLSDAVTYSLTVQAQQDWGGMGGSTWRNTTQNGVTPGTRNIEIVLEEGLTITGSIADSEGKPIPNAMLYCQVKATDGKRSGQGRQVMADASGAFTAAGLEPGEADFQLQDYTGTGQGLVIMNGEKIAVGSRDVQLVASKGLTITGSLVDEAGNALKNTWVNANPKGGGRSRNARVTDTGSFEITGLAAGVSYSVTAQVPNRPIAKQDDVAAGFNGLHLIALKGLEATGRLLDVEGNPLKNTAIIVNLQGDPAQRQQSQSDAEGNFKLVGLLDGTYDATCYLQTPRPGGGGMTQSVRKCGTVMGGGVGVELRALAEGK